MAAESTPKHLHIVMPPVPSVLAEAAAGPTPGRDAGRDAGGAALEAAAASADGLLYTCKTCEGGPDKPDPISINVTSCLFRGHTYTHPTLEAARKVHPCRYFDEAHLARVCALIGPEKTRTGAYGWFGCGEKGVERLSARMEAVLQGGAAAGHPRGVQG